MVQRKVWTICAVPSPVLPLLVAERTTHVHGTHVAVPISTSSYIWRQWQVKRTQRTHRSVHPSLSGTSPVVRRRSCLLRGLRHVAERPATVGGPQVRQAMVDHTMCASCNCGCVAWRFKCQGHLKCVRCFCYSYAFQAMRDWPVLLCRVLLPRYPLTRLTNRWRIPLQFEVASLGLLWVGQPLGNTHAELVCWAELWSTRKNKVACPTRRSSVTIMRTRASWRKEICDIRKPTADMKREGRCLRKRMVPYSKKKMATERRTMQMCQQEYHALMEEYGHWRSTRKKTARGLKTKGVTGSGRLCQGIRKGPDVGGLRFSDAVSLSAQTIRLGRILKHRKIWRVVLLRATVCVFLCVVALFFGVVHVLLRLSACSLLPLLLHVLGCVYCEQNTHKYSTYRVAQHDHISSREHAWPKSCQAQDCTSLCPWNDCHPRVMSHSLPHLTLTTSTSSLSLSPISSTSPIFPTVSPSQTSPMTPNPWKPCDVPRHSGGSTQINHLSQVMSPNWLRSKQSTPKRSSLKTSSPEELTLEGISQDRSVSKTGKIYGS